MTLSSALWSKVSSLNLSHPLMLFAMHMGEPKRAPTMFQWQYRPLRIKFTCRYVRLILKANQRLHWRFHQARHPQPQRWIQRSNRSLWLIYRLSSRTINSSSQLWNFMRLLFTRQCLIKRSRSKQCSLSGYSISLQPHHFPKSLHKQCFQQIISLVFTHLKGLSGASKWLNPLQTISF